MLGKLRRFLGEPFHQGLAYVEGRKVDLNELTISREVCWGAQTSLGESIHQGPVYVQERKVKINELTISLARVCWGSSGISWASLSTRVWLKRRAGRLIKMSSPSVLHVCAVAAQASPGRVYPPGSG